MSSKQKTKIHSELNGGILGLLIYSICSISLTIWYCGGCMMLDLFGTVDRSITTVLCLVSLIFGIVGVFWANMIQTPTKNSYVTAALIFSIISLFISVYSVILYIDMLKFWTMILGNFGVDVTTLVKPY